MALNASFTALVEGKVIDVRSMLLARDGIIQRCLDRVPTDRWTREEDRAR